MATKREETDQLDPAHGNVEQIREILFGGHIRAFDERFDLVESRLAKESDALRKALEKRVLELERLLGEYREEAADQLSAESSNRDLALNKLELALASARMDIENQMAEMQDRFNADIKDLKSELKALGKELSTALNKADTAQGKRADQLEEKKVDRKELSRLLTQIADKIQPAKPKRGK
ncbi:MAG: hypothetical protein R3348_08190 [Xanthomonadales bacterium]|nr:hypothetical protein [Xanthomonadales bacterium]